jgi:hypothetical protein
VIDHLLEGPRGARQGSSSACSAAGGLDDAKVNIAVPGERWRLCTEAEAQAMAFS